MRQDNQAALDATFRLTLDLADISEHQGWRTARDQVLSALEAGPGLVALLGPAGTGKTLLLRELARVLRVAGRRVELVGRGDLQFDLGTSEVALVDEAARMDEAALDSVSLPGVAAVLADLPSLEARLDGLGVVVTVVRLAPLRPDEVGAFVAERLDRAGQSAELLTAGAVEALAIHSAGVPRVLNLLARAALFMAETEAAAQVEERHVSMAVALREGGVPEMDGLSKPPDIRVQFSPVPLGTPLDADCCEEAQAAEPCPESEVEDSEAETLLPASSVDLVAPETLEAVKPEPPAPPETPAHKSPVSRSRGRAIRRSSALLAASILLIALSIAGWSHRPYLTEKMRAALTYATASPAAAPEPTVTSAAGE